MQLKELGQHPVSETSPAGSDPRQSPEYERLLEEIGKLSSLQGGAAVDWAAVVGSAASVLEKQAKDIPAAVYLCVGLAHIDGVQGMADGVRVLADMLRQWWDVCFPPLKRLRARSNMIVWWRERLAALLDATTEPVSVAVRDELLAALTELDATLADRLPDLPPLRDMLERVQRLETDAPPEEAPAPSDVPQAPEEAAASPPPPAAAQTPPTPEPPVAPAPSAPARPLPSPEDEQEAAAQFLAAARAYAALAFAEEVPRAPAAWSALYAALWGRMDKLPPADGGTTALPAPPGEELAACRNLLAAGRAAESAAALARLLPACPFCLDAQFLLFSALTACRRPHEAARVLHETRTLAERLPGLTALAFADGSPLASPQTRQWLEASDAPPPAGPAAAGEEDVTPAARAAASRGDLGAALDLLDDAQRQAGRRTARSFPLRIEQARLLLAAGHGEAAVPLAEELEETIARHALGDWQEDLCLEALRVCHAVWSARDTPEARQRAAAAAAALCRLRPSRSPFL